MLLAYPKSKMADNMAAKTLKMPYTHFIFSANQNVSANLTIRKVYLTTEF